jgi:16S rRNA (cytidine1402-2'-O)-methyltransferase
MPGRLTVCPTPIGNLDDLSPRVRAALATCDLVACEDTRHTGLLLHRLGIAVPMVCVEAHREARRAPEIGARLVEGAHVCLVSDAGTPGLSDPGRTVVAAARDCGAEIEVLPGPSAITTAIVAAGLPADRFAFVGFLPRSEGAIERVLDEIDSWAMTVVAFESPRRLPRTLAVIARRAPQRLVAVCRELTKLHEEVVVGPAVTVVERFAEAPKGEVTLVLGAAEQTATAPAEVEAALRDLRTRGFGAREAARLVSSLTGLPARDLYRP